ncbi:MAG: DUF3108 domain-containing protein [Candidatus Binataceae bacterium]
MIHTFYSILYVRQNPLDASRIGGGASLWRTAVMALALLALSVKSARAQTASKPHHRRPPVAKPVALPANLTIPHYAPGDIPFSDGEVLTYEATWMDIPAAQARVSIHHQRRNPALWSGEMWITSSKPVDLIYRMRDYIREDFQRQSLAPRGMYIVQHEKHRFDVWHDSFDQRTHVVVSSERDTRGRIKTREFIGGQPWGPFSGTLMALSQPLNVGDKLTFDVFSGGNRYVFRFNVKTRERITTTLGTFDTLRIEPSVVWLSNGKFRSQARQTTVWVTTKGHVPVRIDAQVIFGNVQADLINISGAPPPAGASTPVEVSARKSTVADPPSSASWLAGILP